MVVNLLEVDVLLVSCRVEEFAHWSLTTVALDLNLTKTEKKKKTVSLLEETGEDLLLYSDN